jgi:hypothetical protein
VHGLERMASRNDGEADGGGEGRGTERQTAGERGEAERVEEATEVKQRRRRRSYSWGDRGGRGVLFAWKFVAWLRISALIVGVVIWEPLVVVATHHEQWPSRSKLRRSEQVQFTRAVADRR